MREEEIDWCVYRVIADGDTKTVSGVISCTKFGLSVVEASLQRLIGAGLITQIQDQLCILSLQESLLYTQIRECADSPLYIEDGVIRLQKNREKTI